MQKITITKPTFTTPRLSLSPLPESAVPELSELLRDPKIAATYMIPDYPTVAQYDALAARFVALSADPARFVLGVFRENRLIGWINDCGTDGKAIELGYALAPAEWGKGYMTEALSAVLPELFGMGFATVRTGYFEGNPASRRVMEKCGMLPVAGEDSVEYRGITHRVFYYELTADKADRSVQRTPRLTLAPLDDAGMLALIESAPAPDLQAAYREMRDLANADPEARPFFVAWQITLTETGERVGDLCFKGPPDERGAVEIGYGIDELYRNRGYCTEAVAKMTEWAFANGAAVVEAETDPQNAASQKVLSHLGFTYCGEGEEGPRFALPDPARSE